MKRKEAQARQRRYIKSSTEVNGKNKHFFDGLGTSAIKGSKLEDFENPLLP